MSTPARKIPATRKAVPAAASEGEYPKTTKGARIAREMREKANKLTSAERDDLLNAAMGMIYGGAVAPEKAGP